ncbi:MAG: serine hydrolase domain-containing protein [Gemmatimonadota bacterium]
MRAGQRPGARRQVPSNNGARRRNPAPAALWGALMVVPTLLGAQVPTDNPLRTRTDSLVHGAVTEFFASACRVGLTMAVSDHDAVRFYDYGSTSRDRAELPTRNTIYEIGSITKTFTGSLVAKALIDGRMKIDADIRTYLTDRYPNLEYRGHAITLRQLSTHQSGLANIPAYDSLFKHPNFETLPYQVIESERGYNRARILEELHQVKLDTVPGSIEFKYSNTGTKIVSFALENVYQMSFAELIRRYITGPLGMTNTTLTIAPGDSGRVATPYGISGKKMPNIRDNLGAAGGIRSTATDMVKYLGWHLHERDPIVIRAHQPLVGNPKSGRGINWWIDTTSSGSRRLAMSGGVFGMSSNLALFPEGKIGLILMTNEGCLDSQGALGKVAERVFDGLHAKGPR